MLDGHMRQIIQEWTSTFFKDCLPQNLLSPLLNTLSHICKENDPYFVGVFQT